MTKASSYFLKGLLFIEAFFISKNMPLIFFAFLKPGEINPRADCIIQFQDSLIFWQSIVLTVKI